MNLAIEPRVVFVLCQSYLNIQWMPLNVITDNVINRLILSEFLIPARTYNMHYKYAAYCNHYIGYCYQFFPNRRRLILLTSNINAKLWRLVTWKTCKHRICSCRDDEIVKELVKNKINLTRVWNPKPRSGSELEFGAVDAATVVK